MSMALHSDDVIPVPKHAYSYKEQGQYAITFHMPSRTKQEFKDECNINVILARYQATGLITNINNREPQYVDTTGYDFQQAMQTIAEAQSAFNDLPASLRDRFGNDPAQFLDFVHDEDNRAEAEKLGLVRPKAAPGDTGGTAIVPPENEPKGSNNSRQAGTGNGNDGSNGS